MSISLTLGRYAHVTASSPLMGYVFEGVLVLDERPERMPESVAGIALATLPVGKAVFAYPATRRGSGRGLFSDELPRIAAYLSEQGRQIVLIRYDDRSGVCEAILYRDGVVGEHFDEDDEVWVEVDENYRPIPNGRTVTARELPDDDEEEYDCVQNAIEVGLAAVGLDCWLELRDLMFARLSR